MVVVEPPVEDAGGVVGVVDAPPLGRAALEWGPVRRPGCFVAARGEDDGVRESRCYILEARVLRTATYRPRGCAVGDWPIRYCGDKASSGRLEFLHDLESR